MKTFSLILMSCITINIFKYTITLVAYYKNIRKKRRLSKKLKNNWLDLKINEPKFSMILCRKILTNYLVLIIMNQDKVNLNNFKVIIKIEYFSKI